MIDDDGCEIVCARELVGFHLISPHFISSHLISSSYFQVYLRSKYPSRSEKELAEMVQARVTGAVAEDEWAYVIRNLYNEDDASALSAQIYQHVDQTAQGMRVCACARAHVGA